MLDDLCVRQTRDEIRVTLSLNEHEAAIEQLALLNGSVLFMRDPFSRREFPELARAIADAFRLEGGAEVALKVENLVLKVGFSENFFDWKEVEMVAEEYCSQLRILRLPSDFVRRPDRPSADAVSANEDCLDVPLAASAKSVVAAALPASKPVVTADAQEDWSDGVPKMKIVVMRMMWLSIKAAQSHAVQREFERRAVTVKRHFTSVLT